MPKSVSNIRKGASVPFKISVTAWLDLLGYGKVIAAADFNPMNAAAKGAMQRLRGFHEVVARHSHRNFRSLTINDGAVFYRDLSWRSPSVTFDFINRAWQMFAAVQEFETGVGAPGARLVLASGFRMSGSRRAKDASVSRFRELFRRLEEGRINAEEAIREAASHRHYSDVIPELQANFAFTKAYVAESSGAKAGIEGPKFYIDTSLFDGSPMQWVKLGEPFLWAEPRLNLSGQFVQVLSIGDNVTRRRISGLRDGLAVAKALAPSDDVLYALHKVPLV